MSEDRRARILELLYPDADSNLETSRLGDVCRQVSGVSGAGLTLMSGDTPWGSVVTTDDVSTTIEDLQFALGEGACGWTSRSPWSTTSTWSRC